MGATVVCADTPPSLRTAATVLRTFTFVHDPLVRMMAAAATAATVALGTAPHDERHPHLQWAMCSRRLSCAWRLVA
jgi:hypothetical protein